MSGIEQGIELTFKTIMKVKDDEINELKKSFKLEIEILYNEIHQRDNEIDKLKNDITDLKAQEHNRLNDCLDELREALQVETEDLHNRLIQRDTELNHLRNIQSEFLIEKELLEKKIKSTATELDAAKKDLQIQTQKRIAGDKMIEEWKTVVEETRNRALALAKKILKSFFFQLGCRTTLKLLNELTVFYDTYGTSKTYSKFEKASIEPEEGDTFEIGDEVYEVCICCYSDNKDMCHYLRA